MIAHIACVVNATFLKLLWAAWLTQNQMRQSSDMQSQQKGHPTYQPVQPQIPAKRLAPQVTELFC